VIREERAQAADQPHPPVQRPGERERAQLADGGVGPGGEGLVGGAEQRQQLVPRGAAAEGEQRLGDLQGRLAQLQERPVDRGLRGQPVGQ
jgi:hypothetical protein